MSSCLDGDSKTDLVQAVRPASVFAAGVVGASARGSIDVSLLHVVQVPGIHPVFGFNTLYTALAVLALVVDFDVLVLPERPVDRGDACEKGKEARNRKAAIFIVSEKYRR